MHKLSRSLFAGFVAMGALAACDDVETTPPPVQVTAVNVVPQNVQVSVGGTATLAATVVGDAGLTDRTVTWSSSNPAVATVDASGTVRGVAAGQTTIIAKSNADPNVQGAAAVVVNPQSVPAVSIASITKNGLPIDIQNVMGQIDVTLNLSPNGAPVSAAEVWVQCPGQTAPVRAAGQTFAGNAPAAGPITLSFNTARLNQAGTAAEWFNGACQVQARLISPAGSPQASPVTLAATFNNADAVLTEIVRSRGPQGDAANNPWWGGDVQVRVTPVIYTSAAVASSITSVAVTFSGTTTTGEAVSKTQNAVGPFPATVTFTGTGGARSTAATNISQLTVPLAAVTTSAVGANNVAIITPGSTPNVFNYDSQAPANGAYAFGTQGTFASVTEGNWVGTAYSFAAGDNAGSLGYSRATTSPMAPLAGAGTIAGNDQGGVDRTSVVFQAASNNTNDRACTSTSVTGWTTVTSGSSVSSSQVNGTSPAGPSYCLRIIESDALGNADTTVVAAPFGVDREDPRLIRSGGVANNSSFDIDGVDQVPTDAFPVAGTAGAAAAMTYNFTLRDTLSGFDATPVNYSITRLDAAGTACVVGTGTACAATDGAQTVVVDSTDRTAQISVTGGSAAEGYFTFNGTFRDRAANSGASALPTRMVLVDNTAPVVSRTGANVPGGGIAGNSTAQFNFDATDNLDLYLANSVLTYPAAAIRSANQQIGTPFDATLTRSVTGQTVTFANFYRSLTADPAVAGAKPTSISIRVTDAATNATLGAPRAIDPQDVASSTYVFGAAAVGLQSFAIVSAQNTAVPATTAGMTVSPNCDDDTSTCTITVRVQGPTGTFENPFAGGGVNLYMVDATTGELVLVNATPNTSGAQTDNGVNRFYTYVFNVPSLSATQTVNYQAIGFTSAGDALLSAPFAVNYVP